jgi:cyclic pyranopterin phosphate synthase
MMDSLRDSFGRTINYLRISLTEQCNFRCLYCMPPEGLPVKPKRFYLKPEAILRFVRVATGLGVTRVRLTGGEPLLRPELNRIVAGLARMNQLQDVSLTTNGFYLKQKAEELKSAGLHRINISLDSLEAQRFKAMARTEGLQQVLEGMDRALAIGFPLKLNVVILKGVNDGEILPFVEWALDRGVTIRFLEFMPLCGSAWNSKLVVPVAEMRQIVAGRFKLQEEFRGDAPAQTFRVSDGKRLGRVGFIGPLSEPFCDSCSRMRLSADGFLQPCLFSQDRYEIRSLLDSESNDDQIAQHIRKAAWLKPRGSKYANLTKPAERQQYLSAYRGMEEQNPLIHNLGG